MKRALVLSLLGLTAACSSSGSSSTARPPADAALEAGADLRSDASGEAPEGDPSACGCSLDPQGTLNLSWSCFCGQSFAACTAPLTVPADCAARVRQDYPACGFTVIITLTGAGLEVPSIYDASGALVGRFAHSDLSGYLCPTDPTMESASERAGQFPASTCRAVSCDPCYAGSFPCPAPDGGTPDAASRPAPPDAATVGREAGADGVTAD